jgi:hypothetical protein
MAETTMKCRSLQVREECDRCSAGYMRPTGKIWWLWEGGEGEYVAKEDFEEIECDKCGHRHVSLASKGFLSQ